MKDKKKLKNIIGVALVVIAAVFVCLYLASSYMLGYSLGYPKNERLSAEHWRSRMKSECPWTKNWMDSVYSYHCVKDTFVVMPSGYRAHAIYLYALEKTAKTAVVVHGYKVRAEGMLHIAYMYNHDLGYNVLLPDLYGHGQSEGDHIQMGWNDRWDVIRWAEVANDLFKPLCNGDISKTSHSLSTDLVIHGISMGAATTMAVAGEKTPPYIKCFVEDCGYSGVWDEFAAQLKDQFGLPSFPLMNTTSWLCRQKYGWSFSEAQQIEQVRRSTKPMLFIHGDKDKFVPYRMLRPLYETKKKGKKAIFIAKGSVHAMAYRDHHEEYTARVRDFVRKIFRSSNEKQSSAVLQSRQ